ncbi:MAG: hypothetical protein M0000_08650 [Actinomycetota bacterium]|nr:hypothetical protein [Actinomycetota bacterium]
MPLIVCAFWLAFPSIGTVFKYLGVPGLVSYSAVVLASLWAIRVWVLPRLTTYLTERQALVLAAFTLMALIAIFVWIHPLVSAPRPGHGSDRNEAMNLATSALLHGRYPYHSRTYLGNPLSPLPGSILLAVPFAWLGDSGYQTFFWLAIFFLTLRRELQGSRPALLLMWIALTLSPVVVQEVMTGGDLLANALYLMVFALSLLRRARERSGWAYAGLFGVGLSSRANFLLLVPLGLVALAERAGWGRALKLTAVSCATFGVVTVPFYLASPGGFSPLHTLRTFDAASARVPWLGVFVFVLDASLAVALAFLRPSRTDAGFLRNCALVLAVPVVSLAIVLGLRTGAAGVDSVGYGLCFLFFGLLSCAKISLDPGLLISPVPRF